MTTQKTDKLQKFINKCFRRITGTRWPDVISNAELLGDAEENPVILQIKIRKWQWIGHILMKEGESTEKQALDWKPQEIRRGERPK